MSAAGELDVFNCPLDGVQLIEASAGTGKTWNICGLYLRLLLEQKRSVREILVVTFTNAATAELRERIRSRLLDLSMALAGSGGDDPFVEGFTQAVIAGGRVDRGEAAERLRLALLSFDEASIFTIHGFCQRALADTPFAAALPFRFELVPDDNDLKRELASDHWRKHVVHGDLDRELTAHLLDRGCGPDWLAVHLSLRLRKPLASLLWPDFSAVEGPPAGLDALNARYREAGTLWRRESEDILALLLASLPRLHGQTYKETSVNLAVSQWQAYFDRQEPLGELGDKQGLLSADVLAQKTKKNCATPEHPFFQQASQLLALHGSLGEGLQLRRLRLLRDWLETAPAELAARKQARRVVSFDDLLGKLFQALEGGDYPWLAEAIRQRFPCALIDEFQDTDPLQFGIFRHIYVSAPSTLFLVGDPKQAIYSFRSADLHTYLAARGQAARLHTLSANQRSCGGLIDACNALFRANARAFVLEGLAYRPVRPGEKPRAAFADASEARGELELWTLPQAEGVRMKGELQALVAAACAAEVARLLNAAGSGLIRIGERPLRASDIALVVRSHAQGSRLRKALAERGVASVELSQQSIFATEQAEETERVLLAVVDPSRAGLLKAALATELVGEDGGCIFGLGSDEARLAAWLKRFQDYRRTWQEQGFAAMWQTLLRDSQTARRVLGSAGGERKLTNLLHLGELLAAAADPRSGPETLLRWLAQRRRDETTDEVAQLRLESDENLVQILTIHKSKGLEYPIVFCPCLWESTSLRGGEGECIAYHLDDGTVLDFSVADEDRARARQAAVLEDAAEQVRLIYVALTRAVHRCYLVAGNYLTAHGKGSSRESGRSLLNWLAAGGGRDYADWAAAGGEPAAITAAWEQLAASTPGIRLGTLSETPGERLRPHDEPVENFTARQLPHPPQEGWRLGSFTGLIRSGTGEHPAADRDPPLPEDAVGEQAESGPPGETPDILRFPRGEQAGHCLHRALELADFTDPGSWPAAIAQALAEFPQEAPDLGIEEQAAMMRTLFEEVLATPLRGEMPLNRVGRARRLPELEFCLPVGHLSPRPLERWLHRHGYGHTVLGFAPYAGYLKGFIDLVFEHGGRYYLLDWKSNHLGSSPEDYGPAGLQRAMDRHGYHLQYLCYVLALHRYLRLRLPGYRYRDHFGGCLYVFLRGVRPGWRSPDGTPAGVYFHRPDEEVLADLERLFTSPSREAHP